MNCLLLKIQFSFVAMCLVLTASMFAFATLYSKSDFLLLLIPLPFFILLKCKCTATEQPMSPFLSYTYLTCRLLNPCTFRAQLSSTTRFTNH